MPSFEADLRRGARRLSGREARRRHGDLLHRAQPQAPARRAARLRHPHDLPDRARRRRPVGDGDDRGAAATRSSRPAPSWATSFPTASARARSAAARTPTARPRRRTPTTAASASATIDPRQRGLFNAAWTLAYAAACARGGIEAVAFGAPTGPFGHIHRRPDYAQPYFDALDGPAVYPAFHVVAGLAALDGATVLVDRGHPRRRRRGPRAARRREDGPLARQPDRRGRHRRASRRAGGRAHRLARRRRLRGADPSRRLPEHGRPRPAGRAGPPRRLLGGATRGVGARGPAPLSGTRRFGRWCSRRPRGPMLGGTGPRRRGNHGAAREPDRRGVGRGRGGAERQPGEHRRGGRPLRPRHRRGRRAGDRGGQGGLPGLEPVGAARAPRRCCRRPPPRSSRARRSSAPCSRARRARRWPRASARRCGRRRSSTSSPASACGSPARCCPRCGPASASRSPARRSARSGSSRRGTSPIAIPAWKIAPALAWGNTVVIKPADLVPGCTWALVDILHRAGLPKGVLNLVMGKGSVVGQAILDSRDITRGQLHRLGRHRPAGRRGLDQGHAQVPARDGRQEPDGGARRRRPRGRGRGLPERRLLLDRPALHRLVAADRAGRHPRPLRRPALASGWRR